MNGYKAFYKDRTCEVYEETSYKAQLVAAKIFKVCKPHEVTVVICEKNGQQVIHSTTEL